jgi:hypothetical protein
MKIRRRILSVVALVAGGVSLLGSALAQTGHVNTKLFSDMCWREIGPVRGGRVRALVGVSSEPATFYFGMVNGGVWKTTDAGATWQSVWDSQPTGSIGSIVGGRGIGSKYGLRCER